MLLFVCFFTDGGNEETFAGTCRQRHVQNTEEAEGAKEKEEKGPERATKVSVMIIYTFNRQPWSYVIFVVVVYGKNFLTCVCVCVYHRWN